jgi:hypothetical protein
VFVDRYITVLCSVCVFVTAVFGVAAINLFWGTCSFTYNTLAHRRQSRMSRLTALANVSAAIIHLVVWVSVIIVYMTVWNRDYGDTGWPYEGQIPGSTDDV